MTRRTWDEMRPRPAAPPAPAEYDNAMRRLAENADFRVFYNHFKDRTDGETVERTAPNASALLLIEGRRSLLRDIKRDVEQADSAGPERSEPD